MHYEIKTDRLLLRPLNIADLEAVHAYASDRENTRFMYFMPHDTEEETRQFLTEAVEEWEKARPGFYEFAVMLGGAQIGGVSVYLDEERTEGELAWIIDRRFWKKGYALEAACAIKDFAVNVLKLSKLTASCDYRNSNSYRLMEKIGLRLENGSGTRIYPKSGEEARELTYSLCVDEIGN